MSLLSETEIRALLISIIGGLFVLAVQWFWRRYRRASLVMSLRDLEWERTHIREIAKSRIALHRAAYRHIFLVFCLIGIAEIIRIISSFMGGKLVALCLTLQAGAWYLVIASSWRQLRIHIGLKDQPATMKKLEAEINAIKQKLDGT